MKLYDYITGQGGFMLLALVVLFIFLYRKWKTERYYKHIEKKRKEKDSKL